MSSCNRRDFLRAAVAAAAGGALFDGAARADEAAKGGKPRPAIFVVHGEDPARMLEAGLAKLGGIAAFVKPGKKVTIKVNAAWASRPEQAGNTSPDLVRAAVRMCKAAGAKEVVLPENTCSDAKKAFAESGIERAASEAGGRLFEVGESKHFRDVRLPAGKVLKEARVAVDVLDTGCLINLPVAKSHGGAVITASLKNWMGAVEDRRTWHRRGLDQCIADFATFIRPDLIVVDATRVMRTNGPDGPGDVAYPKQIILGRDPVAIDAYAATLFDLRPFDVPHIRIAHEMGIGMGDLKRVDAVHLEAR